MLSENMTNCSLFLQTLQMAVEDGGSILFSQTAMNGLIAALDQAAIDAKALETRPIPIGFQTAFNATENVLQFPMGGSSNDLAS